MRVLWLVAGLGALAFLALAGTAAADLEHVHILGSGSNAYMEPDPARFEPGDTVVWHNHDAVPHTATESGSEDWNTGLIAADQTSTAIAFNDPARWVYECTVHSGTMNGYELILNTNPAVAFTAPGEGSSVAPGEAFTLTGTATDADGQPLTLTATVDGAPASPDGTNPWSLNVEASMAHNHQHTVIVTATDSLGGTAAATRHVRVNRVPSVDFTVSPASPTSAQTVAFNSTVTDDHLINNHLWDFGDGGTSAAANATHRFAKGAYRVYLNVTDDHGATASRDRALTVRNSAPAPDFRLEPADPVVNERIDFTDLTEDIDGDAVNWTWDFGDGAGSFARNATHTYTTTGTYTVRLTVRDVEGLAANVTRAVEVVQFATQRPVATLGADPVRGIAPLAVTFTLGGSDPDGSVASWSLDFGDGAPVTGPGSLLGDPEPFTTGHTFQRNGTYEVVLTLTDDLGAQGTNRTAIVVDPPPNRPPQVRFEVAPTASPRKGQALIFADGSTDLDFEDRPVSWRWDFGDGAVVCCDRPTVTHAYARVGRFQVTLTVTDTLGAAATLPLSIEVRGEAPRVLLAVNDTTGRAPFAASFTLDARDADGTIVRWSLEFGDGSPPLTGEGPPPNATQRHVYDRAGPFAAALEAVDDDGLVGRSSVSLEVGARAPEPIPLPSSAISATPTGQRFTYRFAATTTLSGDLTYQWAFGDGRTAAGRDLPYSYAEAGTYTVTLTIMGPDGPVARGSIPLTVGEESTAGGQRVRTEAASGVVRVVWNGDPRAAGYQVWRQEGSGRFEEVAVVTGATHFDDLDVRDGVAYAYRVTFFSADGRGRLQLLSQLNSTEGFRLLGEVRATGLVDSDGDGVGDTRDAFPQDAGRAVVGPSPLGPILLVVIALMLGYGAWRFRDVLMGTAPRPLTAIPGLLPEHAAVLLAAGIEDSAALAQADPSDLSRRTVLPKHQVEPWVGVAQLLQVPGISGQEAAALQRAGVRGRHDLARASPEALAGRTGAPLPKAQRWVRSARDLGGAGAG